MTTVIVQCRQYNMWWKSWE